MPILGELIAQLFPFGPPRSLVLASWNVNVFKISLGHVSCASMLVNIHTRARLAMVCDKRKAFSIEHTVQ